jgi:hypothetical protein
MEGGLHLPRGQDQTIRYDVASLAGVSVPAGTQDEKRYLQLPPLSAAFRAVAARAARGTTRTEKADAVRAYLMAHNAHSLDPTATSVGDFVVNGHSGYCEHVATAMVLLLRCEGVPCRLVSGFMGTEWNSAAGYLIVRASDAHTWVEVLADGRWLRYDPTPPAFQQVRAHADLLDGIPMAWYRTVVTYDLSRQVATLLAAGRTASRVEAALEQGLRSTGQVAARLLRLWPVLLGVAAGVLLVVLLLRHVHREMRTALITAFEQAAGARRLPGETLLELARRTSPDGSLDALAWQVYAVLFDPHSLEDWQELLLRLLRRRSGLGGR